MGFPEWMLVGAALAFRTDGGVLGEQKEAERVGRVCGLQLSVLSCSGVCSLCPLLSSLLLSPGSEVIFGWCLSDASCNGTGPPHSGSDRKSSSDRWFGGASEGRALEPGCLGLNLISITNHLRDL